MSCTQKKFLNRCDSGLELRLHIPNCNIKRTCFFARVNAVHNIFKSIWSAAQRRRVYCDTLLRMHIQRSKPFLVIRLLFFFSILRNDVCNIDLRTVSRLFAFLTLKKDAIIFSFFLNKSFLIFLHLIQMKSRKVFECS